jgi:hypothetical protein
MPRECPDLRFRVLRPEPDLGPSSLEGYVDWERAEAIRRMVSENIPTSQHHGALKHSDALLADAADAS